MLLPNPRHGGRSVAIGVLLIALNAAGVILPPDFTENLVADGLNAATAMAIAPDGRFFVCEQTGAVRIIKNRVLLPEPFATVNTQAIAERGLVGITLHPNFAVNGWVYVYHTT